MYVHCSLVFILSPRIKHVFEDDTCLPQNDLCKVNENHILPNGIACISNLPHVGIAIIVIHVYVTLICFLLVGYIQF